MVRKTPNLVIRASWSGAERRGMKGAEGGCETKCLAQNATSMKRSRSSCDIIKYRCGVSFLAQ